MAHQSQKVWNELETVLSHLKVAQNSFQHLHFDGLL